MMACANDCDTNLTTDAYPSPPREEHVDPKHNVYEFAASQGKPPSSYKTNKKKKNKAVSVNVTHNSFNISHSNKVHIGTKNIYKAQNKDEQSKEVPKTQAIKDLFNKTDPVTKESIDFVSDHIGANWKQFGQELGYLDGEIYQFHENNYVRGIRDVVCELLLDWIRNKPDKAQVGALCTALWKANEREVVQMMAEKAEVH